MNKKRKVLLIATGITIVLSISLAIYGISFHKKEEVPAKKIEVIDSISGYDYKLEDRDFEIYKVEFLLLKSILEKDQVNFEEYAKSIARMFIIDLYTLNNKLNKYDVGSIDFIYPDIIENYSLNVKDTLYKYLQDNMDDKRNQELPEVTEVKVELAEEIEYELADKKIPAYRIELSWSYKKDMGYDTEGVVIVAKQNEMLYVVEKKDIDKK